MKSKILALSKNEEFKDLLKKKKISNKYVNIYFGKLTDKNKRKLILVLWLRKKLVMQLREIKLKDV